jgi:hypothetical protein
MSRVIEIDLIRFTAGLYTGQYAIMLEREPIFGIVDIGGTHIFNWDAYSVLAAEETPEHPEADHAALAWLNANPIECPPTITPDQRNRMEGLAEKWRLKFPDHRVVVGRQADPDYLAWRAKQDERAFNAEVRAKPDKWQLTDADWFHANRPPDEDDGLSGSVLGHLQEEMGELGPGDEDLREQARKEAIFGDADEFINDEEKRMGFAIESCRWCGKPTKWISSGYLNDPDETPPYCPECKEQAEKEMGYEQE